jgi:hypothetical protein
MQYPSRLCSGDSGNRCERYALTLFAKQRPETTPIFVDFQRQVKPENRAPHLLTNSTLTPWLQVEDCWSKIGGQGEPATTFLKI